MKTKHTKGEWEITKYETPNEYNQPDLSHFQISSKNENRIDICCLWPIKRIDKKYIKDTYVYQSEETEANAKLIAAAPELLDALNELLKFHVRYFKGSAVGAKYRNKAEQAIKKATK